MDYLLTIIVLWGIYVALGVSYTLLLGYTGIFSVAQAAFFGVGAYVAAIFSVKLKLDWGLQILAALVVSGLLGFLISYSMTRVKDEYLIIASFGFQIIATDIFTNLGITGGAVGIAGVSQPTLGFSSTFFYPVLCVILAVLCVSLGVVVSKSKLGLIMRAVRGNETATRSLGINVNFVKAGVFGMSAALAAVVGTVFAHYQQFVSPNGFDINESILILTVALIGGVSNSIGPILGSLVVVGLPQLLTFVPAAANVVGPLQQLLYGALLVAFMLFRPKGLLNDDYQLKLKRLSRKKEVVERG